jgi:hypothetical protein
MTPAAKRWLFLLSVLLLAGVALLAYSARDDLAPFINRLQADEGKWFSADAPPQEMDRHLFDLGIVDADGDGDYDVFTSNHNYRQTILLAQPQGGYHDTLTAWGLDQNRDFPGWEQSFTAPVMDRPGLYIYWLGETLTLRAQGLDANQLVAGTLKMFSKIDVLRSQGFQLKQHTRAVADSPIPQTVIEFSVRGDGQLELSPLSRGVPTDIEINPALATSKIFVGNQRTSPAGHVFSPFLRDRHGLAWADINADGHLDIAITRGGVGGTLRKLPQDLRQLIQDELFVSDTATRFMDRTAALGITKKDCSGRHVEWVDFDADGRLDLFINCQDRGKSQGVFPKQLWRQDSDGRFQDVATEVGLGLPGHELNDFVWLDAEGDGDLDLLTTEGKGFFLFRNGSNHFQQEFIAKGAFARADVAGLTGETNNYWRFDGKLSTADYDADGDLDIFAASKQGNSLLVNEQGRFVLTAPAASGLPAKSVAATWVDYDNDGLTDLYTLPGGLYRQEASHRFHASRLLTVPSHKYHAAIVHWYDRDNDGKRDLLVAMNENNSLWRWWEKPFKTWDDRFVWTLAAYRNLGSAHHWLNIDVKGPAGNRQAIGARVTVTTPQGDQVQEVGGNDASYFSQGHYRLYFGLGPHARADRVHVRWSDGRSADYTNVAADRLLTLVPPTPAN